jgi:hypothetical protein
MDACRFTSKASRPARGVTVLGPSGCTLSDIGCREAAFALVKGHLSRCLAIAGIADKRITSDGGHRGFRIVCRGHMGNPGLISIAHEGADGFGLYNVTGDCLDHQASRLESLWWHPALTVESRNLSSDALTS